ncbi:MAG: hypothetical protein AABY22_07120 [Nanoarchaeota archaeon]
MNLFDNINTNNSKLEIQECGEKLKVRIINENPIFLEQEINKYYNWGGIDDTDEFFDIKSRLFVTDKNRFLNCIKNILENRCWLNGLNYEFEENSRFDKFFTERAARIYYYLQKVVFI